MASGWQCPECGQVVSADLEVCWNCGTSTAGVRDPNFQHADDYVPPLPEPKRQFGLRYVFLIVTGFCLIFSLFNAIGYAERDPDSNPSWLLINIALAGVVFLFVLSWITTALVRWIQRKSREDPSPPSDAG